MVRSGFPWVAIVTLVALSVPPAPLRAKPGEPSPVVVILVPFRAIAPALTTPAPEDVLPDVEIEPPVTAIEAPLSALIPIAYGPLPKVDIVTSFAVIFESAPVAYNPIADAPDVVTNPPLMVVWPPAPVNTPMTLSPAVVTLVLVRYSVPPLAVQDALPL